MAQIASRYSEPNSWLRSPFKKITPWALAEVARVSLAFGNEHRRVEATEDDVLRCCAAHSALNDPDLRTVTLDGFRKFMLRLANEQMPYQLPVGHELARSIALFEQTTADHAMEILSGDWVQRLLNCSVAEYVGVAFLFYAGSLKNGGRFDLDWLSQDDFRRITDEVDSDTIARVAHDNFITSPAEVRRNLPTPTASQHPETHRYLFNPLEARPVLADVIDELLVPVPGLLIRKVSPLGLYYTAVERWGEPFTRDLGYLFEAYVGRNLALMDGATVYPAITYDRDKKQSVDWLAVFRDVVVLVEVKSTRPTAAVRSGSDAAVTDLKKRLDKAVGQLSTTAGLIKRRESAFNDIPHDRPIVGLVVTMEPFHVINAQPYRQLLPSCTEPFRVCAAFELEHLVTIEDQTAGEFLLNLVNDEQQQDSAIDTALAGHGHRFRRNSVIDTAFAQLPWNERGDLPT
ncbi:hypothetical protein [Amycolatopsis sp. NPDC051102]|uniref:hypothetical protein n=1 Tax=Amycolatopsis sp. NPDC051102 TaxID=3155163 RepID=UPI0034143860